MNISTGQLLMGAARAYSSPSVLRGVHHVHVRSGLRVIAQVSFGTCHSTRVHGHSDPRSWGVTAAELPT